MIRRAIVLVPAFEKREQSAARDQLVDALLHYSEGWKTTAEEPQDHDGQNVVYVKADPRDEREGITAGVYEAYWGDLIPDWSNQSPWKRLKRGTSLVSYWTVGGLFKALVKRKLPSRTLIAMAIAAVMLVAWYIAVVLVVVQAVAAGSFSFEEFDSFVPPSIKEEIVKIATTIADWPFVVFFAGLLGMGMLEKLVNISAFTKAYLQDFPTENSSVGLRAKTRNRVLSVLDHVHSRKGEFAYDEVFVVAHSLGGAIAVDALAEYGKYLENTSLFTWGTSIGLLIPQDPWLEVEIEKLRESDPPISSWDDVVFRKDFLGSKVPMPKNRKKPAEAADQVKPAIPRLTEPSLPKGISVFSERIHHGYYSSEMALRPLLEPVKKHELS